MESVIAKLDVRLFGITLGCIWGFSVLGLGVVSMATHWGSKIVKLFAKVYVGYESTLFGSVIGAVWGFIDGAISGMLIAWVYNRFIF